MEAWHLIRTKPAKEYRVRDLLRPHLSDLFLPLLRKLIYSRGNFTNKVVPLFPCYLFAKFDLDEKYAFVKYARGVRELVCCRDRSTDLPESVVQQLRQRCAGGPVEISPPRFKSGDAVSIVEGPFRGLEAVFERYLSGAERVAILLHSLEKTAPRVILPPRALRYQLEIERAVGE